MALSNSDGETAARTECSKVPVKERVKATRRKKAHTVTRIKTVCKTVSRDPVQVAQAPSSKANPPKAAVAAASKSAAEKAGLRPVKEEAATGPGGYRIQVGAFDSKGAAQQHLTKISKQYGKVVSAASSQVQPASKGAFRARFNGFSASGAKAACAALAAKGERCLVLSPG
ncbi:MAG: hypothetical protein B7Y99_05785 [Caulobacterales bacterium 32-69-10]|nr:MAG: hypothetical protein B7Y99_05785 [Caulobacterales bacterium 32-69-10]